MLGELLLKAATPLMQKMAAVLAAKKVQENHLLYALWGLLIFIFATFISQFYVVGAVLLAVFTLVSAVRKITKPMEAGISPTYVAVAAVCLFLIGLGYDNTYMTPVCFLLLTWLLWAVAHFAYPQLKTFAGTGEMLLAVMAMAVFPVYIPVITIFAGVLYIVVTGVAVAQQFLKRSD